MGAWSKAALYAKLTDPRESDYLAMPTQVLLNGQPRDLEMPTTVQALVTKLGLHPDQVAVEVNRKLVPRAQQGQVLLAEGDRIEIVTLVGGG